MMAWLLRQGLLVPDLLTDAQWEQISAHLERTTPCASCERVLAEYRSGSSENEPQTST